MKRHTYSRLTAIRMRNDQTGLDMQELRPRFEALKERHAEGTAPQAIAADQLFQTPQALAARLVASLGDLTGGRVLEPSAGLGRLLDEIEAREVVAVEVSPDCAGQLFKEDREGVELLQRDFLELDPEETGLFDAVAMNPPFTMRSDIKHIKHALTFLKEGGTLSALCMNTRHRVYALRDMCDSWEEIPAGTFRKEGTNIETVLLTITK